MATVNKDFVVKNGVVAGANVQGAKLISTTSSEPPIIVTSTASVANLNVDLLDGQHGSHYLDFNNATNKPSPTITFTGDISGDVTLSNLTSSSVSLTIAPNSVALGTDTTGTYVAGAIGGTGITITGTAGEGWSPTISVDATASVSWANVSSKPSPVIGVNLTGNTTGAASATLTQLANGQISIITNTAHAGTASSIAGSLVTGTVANATNSSHANTASSIAGSLVTGTVANATNAAHAQTASSINGSLVTGTVARATHADTASAINWAGVTAKPSPIIGVNLTGDVTGAASATLTSLANGQISITTTVSPDSVALGTDTTGNYVAGLVAGTGVTLSATSGEGISPTISIGQNVSTSSSVTFGHATFSETTGAPFAVSSSVLVNNLNSQYLGGFTAQQLMSQSGVTSINGTANQIAVSASTGAVVVSLPNNVNIPGSLTVGENFIVTGSTVVVNSTVVSIDDPIFTLGGDTAPPVDDNKDRGIEFRWHDGTTARVGFFGFDDSTGKFTFIPTATNSSEVFSGTKGTLDANLEWADVLSKPSPVIGVNLTGNTTGAASATLTQLANGQISITTTTNHAATASSIAGALVTGTVSNAANATNATHANTASSINASLITGTTLPAAIVNSSLTSVGTLTNLSVTNVINGRVASANFALHSTTASSIAGSLVTGTVANATNAVHAQTASSIAGSLVTGTVANATNAVHANTASSINWAGVTSKPSPIIGVNLTGDVTGAASATLTSLGNGQISIAATIAPDSIILGTDTTGSYVALINGTSNQVNVSGSGTENAVVTLSLPQNIHTAATPTFAGVNVDHGRITSHSVTLTTNSASTVIDSFTASVTSTAEYVVQAKQGTKMTATKIIVMWDGTNVYVSEYSIVDSSAGAANATFNASESGGTISFFATSPDAGSTNVIIKAVRTAINA